MKEIFDLLASQQFLVAAWKNPQVSEELSELISATTKYTQFHY